MNKKILICAALALGGTMLLSSCQGRKMSNMTPTGDTVEVNVTPVQDTTDTSI